MVELKEIRRVLGPMNLAEVSRRAGVHRNALYKLMTKQVDPRYSTIKKLVDYLKSEGRITEK